MAERIPRSLGFDIGETWQLPCHLFLSLYFSFSSSLSKLSHTEDCRDLEALLALRGPLWPFSFHPLLSLPLFPSSLFIFIGIPNRTSKPYRLTIGMFWHILNHLVQAWLANHTWRYSYYDYNENLKTGRLATHTMLGLGVGYWW